MAKLDRYHPSGTFGGVTFYQINGSTYVRAKSSLESKRVRKSSAFEKTRKYASDMGRAAKIASLIYRGLPANIRERWFFRAITGEAASLLYGGKTEQEVQELLYNKYIVNTGVREEGVFGPKGHNAMPSGKETNKAVRACFAERWEKQGRISGRFKHAWQKRGYFSWHSFRDLMKATAGIWRHSYM